MGATSLWAGTTTLLNIDYSTVTTPAWTVVGGNGSITDGAWVHAQGGGGGNRSAYLDFGIASSIDDNWTVEFDAILKPGTDRNDQQITVSGANTTYTNNTSATGYMYFAVKEESNGGTTYTVKIGNADVATGVTLANGTTYHFKVEYDGTSAVTAYIGETKYTGTAEIANVGKLRGLHSCVARYNGQATFDNIVVKKEVDVEEVTNPVIAVAYAGANRTVTITGGISSESNVVTTYYTTDGSTPTSSSNVYSSSPLDISTDCTIKAISISSTGTSSDVVSQSVTVGKYTLNAPTISLTEFSLNDGLYNPTYTFTSDQSGIEGDPVVTYTYTFDGGAATNGTSYTATTDGSITVTVSAENYTSNTTIMTIDGGYFYKSYGFNAINDVTVDMDAVEWGNANMVSGAGWSHTALANCTYTLRNDMSLSGFMYARATSAETKQGFYTRTGSGTINFTLSTGEYILFTTLGANVIANSEATSQSFTQWSNVRAMDIYTPIPATAVALADGDAKRVTFKNATNGTNAWDNWMIDVFGNGIKAAKVRADWWDDIANNNSGFTYAYTYSNNGGTTATNVNWGTDFNTVMADADIDFTLSYTGGTFYVIGTMTKGDVVYYVNYAKSGLSGNVCYNLYGNNATLTGITTAAASVLTTPAHPTNVAVALGTNGYATYANNVYPLDLTSATAYKAAVDGEKVKFTLFEQAVPAGTGMLVEGTPSTTVNLPIADASTAVAGNAFLVNTSDAVFAAEDGYTYYAMMKDSDPLTFGTFNPATLAFPATKAYLKVAAGGGARLYAAFGDDETTGINSVQGSGLKVNGSEAVYNLQGQRVAAPQKGLYIINGKKVIVK